MYTQSATRLHLLSTGANLGALTTFAWIPKQSWEIVEFGLMPTTAVGNATVEAIISLSVTATGISIDKKSVVTATKNTAVGTDIKGTAYAAGKLPCDVLAGETVTIALDTAATVDTAGVCQVYLILKEKP